MNILLRTLVASAAALLVCAAAHAEMRAFDTRSMDAIRATHAGKPFVVAFWSVSCAPCRDEMSLWKAILRQHPGMALVLVATDPPEEKAATAKFLARYNPGRAETWAFASSFSEQLRFSVDRRWHGELPRTYFFDASHNAVAQSGLVERAWIETWWTEQHPAPSGKRSK